MKVLVFLPVVISSLLAGAHFSRSGSSLLAVASIALPFLLLVRHRFVPLLLTLSLLLAGAEWLRTLYILTGRYQEAGLSVSRLTTILGVVSVVTLFSPLVFRTEIMRRRFGWKDVTPR